MVVGNTKFYCRAKSQLKRLKIENQFERDHFTCNDTEGHKKETYIRPIGFIIGSSSKVKTSNQWGLTSKTLLCTCMMTHAFWSDFFAVATRLRHKISWWEVFLENLKKRRPIFLSL